LLSDKAEFLEKDYKMDERKFSNNPDKEAVSSGKSKKKVDDLINLSDDDKDGEMFKEDKATDLGEEMLEEHEE
jgi:hypothetical protein